MTNCVGYVIGGVEEGSFEYRGTVIGTCYNFLRINKKKIVV